MTDLVVFNYQGAAVAFDPAAKMWNLNAMHQAVGGLSHKSPHKWLGQVQAGELLAALAEEEQKLGEISPSLVVTQEGRSGGTWAHWQLAAAYAHYLDPRFYLQWNRWAMERVTGQEAPSAALAALEARVEALEGRRARRATSTVEVLSIELSEVLDALRQLGGRARTAQLAALVAAPTRSAFDMRLHRLVRRGLVRRPFYGIYELPA